MMLNWFSPLSPARTGIAQYTADLLGALSSQIAVRLWSDHAEWDRGLERYAEVRQYDAGRMPWAELNRADLNVYHLGNNTQFHSGVWQVSRQQPGLVVLHDACLQHFFAGYYFGRHDEKGYVEQMSALYGEEGRQRAEAFLRGSGDLDAMAMEFPLTELALQNALGAVVHSPNVYERLMQSAACPAALLPLPYAAASEATFREWKAATRPAGPPYRLVVFGHLNPNRRLDALLDALGSLPRKDQFRLDIFGSVWDGAHVKSKARACGLEQAVRVRGFVDNLDDELAQADLAVNLRYPSMGEASISELRIWDHALPSMVTKTGWYESLPPETVAFVRPENEILDIAAHLQAFLRDPGGFVRMGEEGRRVLRERHRPESYVQGLLNLIAEARNFQPAAAALRLADRVGEDMRRWVSGECRSEFADKVGTDIFECFGPARGARQRA